MEEGRGEGGFGGTVAAGWAAAGTALLEARQRSARHSPSFERAASPHRKHEDGPRIGEEGSLLEAKPRLEDDGRQQAVEEGRGREAQRLAQPADAARHAWVVWVVEGGRGGGTVGRESRRGGAWSRATAAAAPH